MLQRSNYIKKNIMRNLANTIKSQDSVTLVGLTFVALILVPTITFVIIEIINGSFNNW